MSGVLVWALLGVVAVLAVGCAVASLLVGDLPGRLHLVTPLTSVGGPALGLAAALTLGWSTATLGALLVVALLAGTAPVLQTAIARAARADGEEAR